MLWVCLWGQLRLLQLLPVKVLVALILVVLQTKRVSFFYFKLRIIRTLQQRLFYWVRSVKLKLTALTSYLFQKKSISVNFILSYRACTEEQDWVCKCNILVKK